MLKNLILLFHSFALKATWEADRCPNREFTGLSGITPLRDPSLGIAVPYATPTPVEKLQMLQNRQPIPAFSRLRSLVLSPCRCCAFHVIQHEKNFSVA